MRGFLFKARAKLIWPRVSPAMERMVFPLTQVGNYSIKEVQIINPSEVPIIYHLVPMNVYPNSIELVRSLPESFNKGEIKIVDENNFDLHDITSVGGKFCYFLVGFICSQTLKTYGYKGKIFIEPYSKINLTKLSGANEIHSN